MEHRKYSKVSPKKVKAWSQNNRKSMSGPPFRHAFEPGSLPRDALETMLGWGPEKPQKKHFLGILFLNHFFLWRVFCNDFLTSSLLTFSSQSIHAHQSEAHLGTKLMTCPINVENWQLRFRSREDTQIKLFKFSMWRLFVNFWYVLSKPVIANPSSKALFTLSLIYGPIWPPF